jgi:hypothetical protein
MALYSARCTGSQGLSRFVAFRAIRSMFVVLNWGGILCWKQVLVIAGGGDSQYTEIRY